MRTDVALAKGLVEDILVTVWQNGNGFHFYLETHDRTGGTTWEYISETDYPTIDSAYSQGEAHARRLLAREHSIMGKIIRSMEAMAQVADGLPCPDCTNDVSDKENGCDECFPLKVVFHRLTQRDVQEA